MPSRHRSALAAILVMLATAAVAQPSEVPRLTERRLDHASYVTLAKQWREHIADHGETAMALVNLGMALDYGDEPDAALAAARRAAQLAPDDPAALGLLGKLLLTREDDEEAALAVLEHCRAVAPDDAAGLTTLAATYLRRGDLDAAAAVMKTVGERHAVERPLLDYAHNTLVGLPEGAVLITAGDNDTFPVLALQAARQMRPDVLVLNRSLLNVPAYVEAVLARHPDLAPGFDAASHRVIMRNGQPTVLSLAVIDAMVARGSAPVFLAATALGPHHGREYDGELEGINLRVGGRHLDVHDTADLFLSRYRLDSATDWTYAWSLVPAVRTMMRNYVAAMARLAADGDLADATRGALLDLAQSIATFHEMGDLRASLQALRRP